MKSEFANPRQLTEAEWHKINDDYFVMNGRSCYGVARFAYPHYVASIVIRERGLQGGDLGLFSSLEDARTQVESWLLDRRQIGMKTVATDIGWETFIVPIQPLIV